MKKFLLGLLFAASGSALNAQCNITFSVAQNPDLGATAVVLTLNGTNAHPGFSVGINWGDGSDMSYGFETTWVHSYPNNGTYQICIDFITPECFQTDYCNSFTLSQAPNNLCPFTANYTVSGNTLTVNASGSGAGDPELSFHPDINEYMNNPWDFSGFQFIDHQHSGTFNHTYSPASGGESYMFCTGYSDMNDQEACEANDYCSSVTFGNVPAGLEEMTDFASTIQVFPVPAETFVNIHFSNAAETENCQWSIVSTDGKLITEGEMKGQQMTVLLPAEMPKGNYNLLLKSGKKQRSVKFIRL